MLSIHCKQGTYRSEWRRYTRRGLNRDIQCRLGSAARLHILGLEGKDLALERLHVAIEPSIGNGHLLHVLAVGGDCKGIRSASSDVGADLLRSC